MPLEASAARNGLHDSQDGERQPLLGQPKPIDGSSVLPAANPTGTGTTNLKVILPALMVCAFLAAFDITVVAAIYPIMLSLHQRHVNISGSDFKGSNRVSWIAVAYILSNTAFQPLYGRLSDIFGRKPCLIFANVVFGIGTLGCALAPGLWSLVISRMVAGVGGGGLNVLGTVILSDLIPLKQRGTFQGYMNIVFATGTSLGAPLGGVVADYFGWRWSFGIQIPLIMISTLIVCFLLHLPAQDISSQTIKEKLKRVDFAGAFTLILCVTALICGLNLGGNELPWTHPLILTILPLSAAFFGAFLLVEGKFAKEPILPLYLLSHRTPLAAALSNWFSTMGAFSVIYNLPLYYQVVLNLSAAKSGLRLIPNSIGTSLGSLGYGILMAKTGRYYWLGMSAYAFQFVGTAILATFNASTPAWEHYLCIVPAGIGFGGTITVLLIALISSVSIKATATGMSYLFRSTGSVVGITTSQCVLQNLLKTWLTARIHGPNAEEIIRKVRESAATIYDPEIVPLELRGIIIETYVQALQVVFLMTVGFVFLNAISGAMLKEHTLHDNLERREDSCSSSGLTAQDA